jgi:protein TonB
MPRETVTTVLVRNHYGADLRIWVVAEDGTSHRLSIVPKLGSTTIALPKSVRLPARVFFVAMPMSPDEPQASDAITVEVVTTAIAPSQPQSVAPPLVEEIDYVRAPAPVYPRESTRKRERGTVLLRVLVDALGHPSRIQVERSSGFDRLDNAARDAVAKALFRPHEVNGVAQPAQVLIPIEFTSRAT